jgi:hypothetical protein
MCQYEELYSFGSGWGLLESPCEFGTEHPGSISHGVGYLAREHTDVIKNILITAGGTGRDNSTDPTVSGETVSSIL